MTKTRHSNEPVAQSIARPADDQQRRTALDPTRSFIIQAPAGSGKTGLLVRRYLTLLARVAEPEEILAITFTRKATAEMRERILRVLKGDDTNGDMLELATKALANDQRLGWNLLHNPSRLKIQTIDAFCYELVKRMPWSARFGATPDVLEQQATELIYRQAAQRTLAHIEGDDALAAHCANLLNLTDARFGQAESLLSDMLSKRDRWMRGLNIGTQYERAEYEIMWQQVIEQELETAAHCIPDEIKPEIAQLAKFAADNPYEGNPNVDLMGCLHMDEFPQPRIENLPHWRGIVALLLTNQLQVRQTVNVRLGFPSNFKQEKGRMKTLLGTIADDVRVLQALIKIPLLPDAVFTEPQWQMLQSLLALLPIAAAELRLLFKENNRADYVEVAQRAEMALGDIESPSDLALFFDYQLKHLLVDEVQDTSQAQYDLLQQLTSGWQHDDGRSLFFVGDPMQSIYRFREAEVAHFLKIQEYGIGEVKPQSLSLETNFRSIVSLVDWYNTVFSTVFPAQDDIINGAVCYSRSCPYELEAEADAVQIHPAEDSSPESEAIRICHQVKLELARNPDAEIGILGRTRTHLVTITQALREQKLPFQSIELESLIKRPAIRDLMALTRGLLQLSDRIAWLSILRAPWCALTLQDISVLSMDNHRSSIVELCKNDKITAHLSADGSQRMNRLLEKLETSLSQRGRVSLRKNVEAAWLNLAGVACIAESDHADCARYFDLLEQLESEYALITSGILSDAVAQLWSQADNKEQIQVLTIHKSKGLEFDVVFLPQLHRKPRHPEQELLRWTRLPNQLLIAPQPHSGAKDDKFYRYLGELERCRTQSELCRLLYVACTRARKKLHLYMSVSRDKKGQLKSPPKNALLNLLWTALEPDITQHLAQASDIAQPSLSSNRLKNEFKRLPLTWEAAMPIGIIMPTPSEQDDAADEKLHPIEFSWASERLRITGIAIHQMLQQIDYQNWQRWKLEDSATLLSKYQTLLMDYGLYGTQFEIGIKNMRTAIDNIKSDTKADWIFSSSHQVEREWPLTAIVNKKISSIIIDRSFIDEQGIRWIIDFKSSYHKGNIEHFIAQEKIRYQQQLERYANIVAMRATKMSEEREIKLGLYFPLLKGWCEWSPS